jgi:hypothetical protein
VKTARVYAELAELAREKGYAAATEHAVKDWRGRGMLPSGRGLGRRRRKPGRIPLSLRQRLLQICHYHYDAGIRDLRIVTLLLWLDGADIDLATVRGALGSIRELPYRVLRLVGHPAARAEPDAPEADLDASAESIARALAAEPAFEQVPADDLVNAARDALRMAAGRGAPEAVGDLEAIAIALGLERAHTESIEGAGPWLDEAPSVGLANALTGLYGGDAERRLAESTDELLLGARDTANRLAVVFDAFATVAHGYPPGAAGLGLLTLMTGQPEQRVFLLYVAVLEPVAAVEFARVFTDEQIAEWRRTAELSRTWLEAHPEQRADAAERGLVAVLRDLGFG